MNDWINISTQVPPTNERGWTPLLWLALDDGTVVAGEGLYCPGWATGAHDWFTGGKQLSIEHPGSKVIAWQTLIPPAHPSIAARIALRD